jgi:hypothetical protein
MRTYLEGAEQAFVDAHHRTSVVELAAVVRCAEQGDELALREELVPVLYDLMGSTDEIHVVLLEEARYNVRTECEADTSIVLTPSGDVFIRVGPQEIAE